ncbi:hypothetical protein [Marinospirillum insulare]|uniref:Flagellar protein FliT n=1 Tax=Marinospirillum insulare TaxID=217169 RepID=A0ABQ5ZYG8_9GAMM|nr:hypothetical protein [Marinospirillum insulare]GLR63033.1 hypothetical protein GCM10007878_04680 [Marinospirillum insulare]
MTSQPINDLKPSEALEQAVKASELLLTELDSFSDIEAGTQLEKVDKLTLVREQLVNQTFDYDWTEEEVEQLKNQFSQLEALNDQLIEKAISVRYDLHQQRVDNQQGRKAVNAYGTTKGQFSR